MEMDMYFYASKPGTTMKQAIEREWELMEFGGLEGEYPTHELGYLRKANQVLGWLDANVGHIENCKLLPITEADVRRLKGTVDEVVAHPERAAELMPGREGFFFGSQEYDDCYFENLLRETSSICSKILDEVDFDGQDVWFRAWW